MKNRSWKAAETRFARDVGKERKPCDGSRDGADFADGLCCYQLKVRKAIPSWLWTWLTGIKATGLMSTPKLIGVLVLKHPRQQDNEALVVLTWAGWKELHGDARKARHGEEKARAGSEAVEAGTREADQSEGRGRPQVEAAGATGHARP